MTNKTKEKCRGCGAILNSSTIGYRQETSIYYDIYLREGEMDYNRQDEEYGDSHFFCKDCGAEALLTEEEVIEILKEEK